MGQSTLKPGLILFAHGARDPRWAEPFERLKSSVATQSAEILVALAYLECMTPDLMTATANLVDGGASSIVVVPIFLGQGGHVRRDLPELVEGLRQRWPTIPIRLTQAVGEDTAVIEAMARYCRRQLEES